MMNLTNNALQLWVEEAKKASYFTKHFVTLSRMIMNGVATMARGLVTLHMRGEDLDQAPLSIKENRWRGDVVHSAQVGPQKAKGRR